MAIRGSEWKNQELAELLQGIFSFVFIFISEIGNQWDIQQQSRTKDRQLSWPGQWTTRFADSYKLTIRKHSAMQNSSFYRTQEAGEGSSEGSLGALPGFLAWFARLALLGYLCYEIHPSTHRNTQHRSERFVVVASEWPTAFYNKKEPSVSCQPSTFLLGHACSLLASLSPKSKVVWELTVGSWFFGSVQTQA